MLSGFCGMATANSQKIKAKNILMHILFFSFGIRFKVASYWLQ